MQLAILYLTSAVIFLAADAVMLRNVMAPLFTRHLGDALLAQPRLAPAALFYLAYIAAGTWLVSLPALRAGLPAQALLNGAILGAAAYGTYEFTNLATLRDWSWQQVIVDMTWGTVLTGASLWAGTLAARAWG